MEKTTLDESKFVPDGKKIASVRRSKEMKQITLADSVGISERKLRQIETKNLPVSATKGAEIADKLGVPFAEIHLSKSGESAEKISIDHVQLRSVTGGELLAMARNPEEFCYHLRVDVTTDQSMHILTILGIIKIYIEANKVDPMLDITKALEIDFPDVQHSAQLNDAIAQLRAMQIGVLANTYYFGEKMPWEQILMLAFVPGDQKSVMVEKMWKHTDRLAF